MLRAQNCVAAQTCTEHDVSTRGLDFAAARDTYVPRTSAQIRRLWPGHDCEADTSPWATSFRSPGCTASSAPRVTCFARSRLLPFTLYALRAIVGQRAHLLHTSAHHEARAGRAWNSWLQIPIEAAPACISRTSTCMVQVPQHSQFRRAMLATECGRETRAHTCRCCSCAHVQLCQAPTISNTMWLHLQLAVPYPTPRTMFQMTGCSPGQRRHARDRHVCSLYTASAGLNHLQLLPCRH